MEQLSEHLPIWVQIFLATGGFLGAGFAAFKGYTSKRREDEPAARPSGDAVVISAALADTSAIRELTSAIRDLRAAMAEIRSETEVVRVIQERNVRGTETAADILREILDFMRQHARRGIR
jgi:hypothetical protein